MDKRFWALLFIIVVVLVGIAVFGNSNKPASSSSSDSGATLASSSIVSDISSVPESVLQVIGKGTAAASPEAISAPDLTSGQKPEVFYEGAEFCPYCATERWPLAVALAKFGSFTNLKLTHSSTTDVYPDTNTLSFYGSTFASSYINFTPVEIYSNVPQDGYYAPLQTPTVAEQALASKYDTSGSIPFVDFGGKYDIQGATYSPSLLQKQSWSEIAGALADPNSPIAKGVDGAANTITAAICELTNNQPANVCNSTILGLESSL